MAVERLQKILARAGVASRRAAEEMIRAGRVRVNGRIEKELGKKADPGLDRIELDGRRIVLEKPAYYVLHKPREVVATMSDPEGRPTVADLLKGVPERVFPVGRLDYHTTGALLVTNDGELSAALLRPESKVPRVYAVKLQGHLTDDQLGALRKGVKLDDGTRTAPAELFVLREDERNSWLQITVTEGKVRQIHRMGEAIGHRVQRLARISFAGVSTDGLRQGEWRPLAAREVEKLKKRYVIPNRHRKAAAGDPTSES
jgi:23S rRNA pseudouridine2605 synthase